MIYNHSHIAPQLISSSTQNIVFDQLVEEVVSQVNRAAGKISEIPGISEAEVFPGNSNKVIFLNLEDGRRMMIKLASHHWAGPRFESARRASTLIRRNSKIIAPKHVVLPENNQDQPIMAYWYIPLPILKKLWPGLSSDQRKEALRSFGRMIRELHQIKVERYGSLVKPEKNYNTISEYMESDLWERLRPAVWSTWNEAVPLLDNLAEMASGLPERKDEATLVHNDLHVGNVFCEFKGSKVRCVGLLDFEAAVGSVPESDLASASVLHYPLFDENQDESSWIKDFERHMLEGYGKQPDMEVLKFFKGYHLLNLGYYSAYIGDVEHAEDVAVMLHQLLDETSSIQNTVSKPEE